MYLNLEIITPERVVVNEEVEMVEAVGAYGEFGVLAGHARFLTTLQTGEIRYTQNGITKHLATSGGFSEVMDDTVTFLVETAEFAEDIDVERAKRAEQRAATVLKGLSAGLPDYKVYEMALFRAITRISVAGKQ